MGDMTEDKIQKELRRLESSYEMYENTKEDTIKHRNSTLDKDGNKVYSDKSTAETLDLIKTMQKDIVDQYKKLGGDVNNLTNPRKSRAKKKKNILAKLMGTIETDSTDNIVEEPIVPTPIAVDDKISSTNDININESLNKDIDTDSESEEEEIRVSVNKEFETPKMNGNIQYDTIPLPSKGQCYKNKISTIPVAFLTANDENLIVSPNLYKDGLFIDYLLKSKIMTNKISSDDMLPGDRDAIILWLRASGYGHIFPVQVVDPETGTQFEADADLTQIKYKPFKLKSDENGYFDYVLPFSEDKVKFKFLTYKDIKELGELEIEEDKSAQKGILQVALEKIKEIIDNDNDSDKTIKRNATNALSSIESYINNITENESTLYTHTVTNRLAMSIMEINGITDRQYIYNYVRNMSVKDSSALRNYISNNEPGLDFNIEIEKPASLGGGSMPMFLSLDQYLFLNIR